MDSVVIIIFVFIIGFIVSYLISNKKINELTAQNSVLNATITEKENALEIIRKDILTNDKEQLYEQNNKLLNPLKQDIENFKVRIEDLNKAQSNERVELKKQIEALQISHKDMLYEAKNLSEALTHDNKAQGDWGEMQLELILQGSGLKEGAEYHKQGSFKNIDNQIYKPDFIVHLPNNKDIIIDAKVSLKDYISYVNGDKDALVKHIKSINNHINNISLKVYENLAGINTLDFIFVFFPIESALLVALEQDYQLFNKAIKKNIAIVSPSTLIMSLKIVHHIWDIDKQNKNTQEIVRLATNMYDKLYGFNSSLDNVKKHLDNATTSYMEAKKRLSDGKGSVFSIAKNMKQLGIKTKKSLDI